MKEPKEKKELENIEENDVEQKDVEQNEESKTNKNVEVAKKILKGILSLICSILYFLSLNVLVIIIILKMAFNNGLIEQIVTNSTDFAKNLSTKEVVDIAYVSEKEMASKQNKNTVNIKLDDKTTNKTDVDVSVLGLEEIDIDEYSEYFESTIKNIMKENNIPEDVLEYVKDTDENREILTNVGADLIQYLYGVTDDFDMNEENIAKLLNSAIDNYEKETGKKVDRSKVNNAVAKFTNEFEKYVEGKAALEIRKIINAVFNGVIFHLMIIITIVFGLILALLNLKEWRFLRKVGIPSFITGITNLIIGALVMPSIDKVSKITALSDSLTLVGGIITGLSVVAIVAFYIIKYTKKKSGEEYA